MARVLKRPNLPSLPFGRSPKSDEPYEDVFEEMTLAEHLDELRSRIVKTFDPKDERSLALRTHCQTSGVSLTEQDPYNNIIRTTIEALAGVLGGTQSLHTNSFDEALALPTADAVRIALRTQQVIAHESGVVNTVDPLGGAYFVEKLTDEMEAAAYDYFARIDELGGMVAAIEANFPQREISDAAFAHQAALENEERIMVGVNAFRVDDDELTEIHRPDPAAAVLGKLSEEQVHEAIDALPEEFREVCSLNLLEELSYQEIAEVLDVPVGTVRSRLHRGRKMLQKTLWEIAEQHGVVARLRSESG